MSIVTDIVICVVHCNCCNCVAVDCQLHHTTMRSQWTTQSSEISLLSVHCGRFVYVVGGPRKVQQLNAPHKATTMNTQKGLLLIDTTAIAIGTTLTMLV